MVNKLELEKGGGGVFLDKDEYREGNNLFFEKLYTKYESEMERGKFGIISYFAGY